MMILPRHRHVLWPFLFPCLGVTAAAAQAAEVSVRAGQDVVLASYYEIRPVDCLPLQAPRVRITAAPRLGKATVVRIQHQAVAAGGRCGTLAVPVAQVHYRAGQPGVDAVDWEVRYQARGVGPAQESARLRILPAPSAAPR